MLAAAQAILDESGPGALTVERVVARAKTSTGAFYARFGDRRGLLHALQDAFLAHLAQEVSGVVERTQQIPDLSDAVQTFVTEFLTSFVENRAAFHAFMLQNLADPEMRARGAQASQGAAAAFAHIVMSHVAGPPTPALEWACDVAFRTLFALATQSVMLDPTEATPQAWDPEKFATEVGRMLVGYLADTA